MRWIERVKTMIRSWLEIQPASGKGLVIREPVSFETNVLRNRIWYRGDACELDQLFKLLGDDEVSRARFWAAAPEDESIRKAHSGLPGIMVDILAGIVKADLNELDFDGPAAQEAAARWAQLAEENDLPGLVSRAVADTLVTGTGHSRSAWTPTSAQIRFWSSVARTRWNTAPATGASRRFASFPLWGNAGGSCVRYMPRPGAV